MSKVREYALEQRVNQLNAIVSEQEDRIVQLERTCKNDNGWCSNCEHFLHDGFKWCPWCGAKVVDE